MKKIVLFLFVLFFSLNNFSQIAYYDAISIRQNIDIKNNGEIIPNITATLYLAEYFNIDKNLNIDLIVDKLENKLSANPFFKSFKFEGSPKGTLNFIPNVSSSIGGLNVTTFADGLAKFIVKRTKQELSIYFFEQFKKDLKGITELQILFPKTYNTLKVIDEDIYNYSKYINVLRGAFEKDLENILVNMQKLPEYEPYKTYFSNHKVLAGIFTESFFISEMLRQGKHPGEILLKLEKRPGIQNIDPQGDLMNSIKLINLFSQSLRSQDSDRYWIHPDDLAKMDHQTFLIYMGLLYQLESKDSINIAGKSMASVFKTIAGSNENIQKYRDFVTALIEKTATVDLLRQELRLNNQVDYQDYFKFFDATLDLIELNIEIKDLPGIPSIPSGTQDEIKKWISNSRIASEIYLDINNRKFSSALYNSILLTDNVLGDEFKNRKEIYKYGSFIATMVEAENSDQVANAIESFALPVGSSRIKRESSYNISLNGYAGFFVGHEWMDNISDNPKINNYALSVPVGLSFSKGKICKKHHSLSIFIPIIDIGAIASYRFGDENAEKVSNVSLEQIISPGMFLSWGIANSPLSLSVGAQMGPRLRDVSVDTNGYSNNYWRFGATLAVDIPLINLYTKPNQ